MTMWISAVQCDSNESIISTDLMHRLHDRPVQSVASEEQAILTKYFDDTFRWKSGFACTLSVDAVNLRFVPMICNLLHVCHNLKYKVEGKSGNLHPYSSSPISAIISHYFGGPYSQSWSTENSNVIDEAFAFKGGGDYQECDYDALMTYLVWNVMHLPQG